MVGDFVGNSLFYKPKNLFYHHYQQVVDKFPLYLSGLS